MKNTILRNSIVILAAILLPALMGAAQAGAVEYKSTYRGIRTQPVYGIATTAAAPSATFQSTSAYSGQWSSEPSSTLLNSDGSVNSGAYMSSGPNRAKKADDDNDGYDDDTGMPVNPVIGGGDGGNTPLGDVLLPLTLLACAYVTYKVSRRRKEA